MTEEIVDVYLDGDPDTESTRRHMERVLSGQPARKWPWVLGVLAGGTALAFWIRRARGENGREQPDRNTLVRAAGPAKPSLSRAGER
jgi:hypothetical protein